LRRLTFQRASATLMAGQKGRLSCDGSVMAGTQFWRHVAGVIRRAPWLAYSARIMWRIRQPRFTAGVVGVVFNEAGQVLLVEHVFHPHHPWGLPGGWVDRNEDPAETVRREMREELELDIRVGPVLLAKVDFGNHLDMAYLCYLNGGIGKLSAELLDYRWADPTALPRLHSFHYRAIQQALSIQSPVKL
jgi:8-oxo-dGTP diphosphatase